MALPESPALAAVAGESALREASAADAVGGVLPASVVEPATPEALATVLAWCTAHRRSVVVRGGGTKISWGRRPAAVDVLLSTGALSTIQRYEPGDLTVTVAAGMRVADLNRELARHGQWLPIDLWDERATVGGVVATNDSGPLRHRYGSARDQLIGIHVATADGRLAAAGGNVVKNVAGYDLGKLLSGSFGCLAAIVSATFKLAPVPAGSLTLVQTFNDGASLSAVAADLASSQLDPISVEVDARVARAGGPWALRLLTRFGGSPGGIEEQAALAERLARSRGPVATERLTGDEDAAEWRERGRRFWAGPGTVVRASWLPAALADVLGRLDALARAGCREVEFSGRAALGAGAIRLSGSESDPTFETTMVERLRSEGGAIRHVVVLRASDGTKARVDVWGVADALMPISRAIKQALDPAGIMNAGRGPI